MFAATAGFFFGITNEYFKKWGLPNFVIVFNKSIIYFFKIYCGLLSFQISKTFLILYINKIFYLIRYSNYLNRTYRLVILRNRYPVIIFNSNYIL